MTDSGVPPGTPSDALFQAGPEVVPGWTVAGQASGVYATIIALVETAAGPQDRIPHACERFAMMVDQVDDTRFEAGAVGALIAALYLSRLALSVTSMHEPRHDPRLFTRTLDEVTGLSSSAKGMLLYVMDGGPRYEDIRDRAVDYVTALPRQGRRAMFETLVLLLRAVVGRHGEDREWDRWYLTGQLLAIAESRID